MGKLFIVVGVIFLAVGVLLYYFPNALSWLGRLPGDIRVERENGAFYFPITTMILVSIFISLIGFLFKR